MKQAFNPYLPEFEYIPDGEPHIFGDRVYVYGSHDKFDAPIFCMGDYVCYSASVEDLSDWRYEGVIYHKNQDPKNRFGLRLLFAPDVCQGPDGRFYLYYAFDFMGIIGVAVCDKPAGHYQFYGYVKHSDGKLWGRRHGDQFPFDPAVLVDGNNVYLYSGFYIPVPSVVTGFKHLRNDGGVVVKLATDMITMISEPRLLFPKAGTAAFAEHEFFEASSIRKDGDRYIFVYSSKNNHELCYATSSRPDGEFVYGGTLVSQGDLYLNNDGSMVHSLNYLGNTHGGLIKIKEQWYIFYHRQTNRHSYSRQACAEEIKQNNAGGFVQAEVTSCGLNNGPLKGKGKYSARIACNLWSKNGVERYDDKKSKHKLKKHPYFTQDGADTSQEDIAKGKRAPVQYIANMQDGAVAGFKYFDFDKETGIRLTVAGHGEGEIVIAKDVNFGQIAGRVKIHQKKDKRIYGGKLTIEPGISALYIKYQGKGYIDFYTIEFI